MVSQMVLVEIIKAGIKQEIAEDLSYRYYKNELTHKDIEYLKENFDIKLEKVEASLKSDIRDLDNKIDNIENNLNNQIDNVRNELKSNIEKVETNLRAAIASVSNKVKL
ncbi:Bdr family repetitive protein (plasmid) [Borrelia miyamotoi]|uniref:Bdr family repetitive protein n=1 Tax=Borrelia miyamotoi TaxID=47466 RepID=A0ABY7VNW0_9SPIR|nr:Bdr family repetitive protein [Borrelia miyamotoi]WCB91016.1 Bdr family repetitive protein [Borrelia miyamotoi]WDE71649.1 Bdr family repetitive protein [Borrelia miyamotoi]WDS49036.1 Bdr family repetitive protein [Borrelia miyamotoi]WEG99543.1 Bdr family repetitive protein [Borrelia miyamotoi]